MSTWRGPVREAHEASMAPPTATAIAFNTRRFASIMLRSRDWMKRA
jgi:hypothetical protein